MAQSQIALRSSAGRQVEDNPAPPCGGLIPLTPALSLGERVNPSRRGEHSRPRGFPLRDARCSLSLGERVRVRGISANDPVAYRTSPGTVELEESSGGAGCFLKRLWELRDGKWRALHSAVVCYCSQSSSFELPASDNELPATNARAGPGDLAGGDSVGRRGPCGHPRRRDLGIWPGAAPAFPGIVAARRGGCFGLPARSGRGFPRAPGRAASG